MDEIIFRSAQKLENLQIQFGLSFQHGKILLHQYSERGLHWATEAWHSPRIAHVQDMLKELIERILEVLEYGRDKVFVVLNPKKFINGFLRALHIEMSRTHIISACIGFVVGGLVGYAYANFVHKQTCCVPPMKGIACTNYGVTDCTAFLDDIPSPHVQETDDVLVQVKASSISATDIEICRGYGKRIRKIMNKYNYFLKSQFPIILGRSCSGIVLEIGQKVSRFDIGDEVFLTAPYWAQGTTCETVVAKDFRVGHKPKRIGFEGAAGIAYAGSIAVATVGNVGIPTVSNEGKRILVCGACTPVGCVIIQYCHLLGHAITATCNMRAAPVAKALGVTDIILIQEHLKTKSDLEIDKTRNLKKELELRDLFDFIFVTIDLGLPYNDLKKHCKPNGRLVSTLPEYLPSDNFGFVLGMIFWTYVRTKCFFQGIFGRSLKDFGEVELDYSQLDVLTEYIDKNNLQSVVDKVFQVHDVNSILDHVQSSESIGSSIVTFR